MSCPPTAFSPETMAQIMSGGDGSSSPEAMQTMLQMAAMNGMNPAALQGLMAGSAAGGNSEGFKLKCT